MIVRNKRFLLNFLKQRGKMNLELFSEISTVDQNLRIGQIIDYFHQSGYLSIDNDIHFDGNITDFSGASDGVIYIFNELSKIHKKTLLSYKIKGAKSGNPPTLTFRYREIITHRDYNWHIIDYFDFTQICGAAPADFNMMTMMFYEKDLICFIKIVHNYIIAEGGIKIPQYEEVMIKPAKRH
jgi:hypothetical protein